jgi:hypothetical protein
VLLELTGEERTAKVRRYGDVDRDGRDELLVHGATTTLLVGADGVVARFSGLTVVAAGDVDQDGLDDLGVLTELHRVGVDLAPVSGDLDLDYTPASDRQVVSALADATADLRADGGADLVYSVDQIDRNRDYVEYAMLGVSGVLTPSVEPSVGALTVLTTPDGAASAVVADAGGGALYQLWPGDPAPLTGGGAKLAQYQTLRALGDVDGDGVTDLAATAVEGRSLTQAVVTDPLGAGSLATVVPGPAGAGTDVAGGFDLDHDGHGDVALTWTDDEGRVHVAVALGPWTTADALDLEVPVDARLTGAIEAAADVDGDGVPDLALGTEDGVIVISGAHVLAHPVPAEIPPPYAELDGCVAAPSGPRALDPSGTAPLEGDLTADDAGLQLLGDWGAVTSLAVGDVDGDQAPICWSGTRSGPGTTTRTRAWSTSCAIRSSAPPRSTTRPSASTAASRSAGSTSPGARSSPPATWTATATRTRSSASTAAWPRSCPAAPTASGAPRTASASTTTRSARRSSRTSTGTGSARSP